MPTRFSHIAEWDGIVSGLDQLREGLGALRWRITI
jgi:hypothetical protein